MGSETIFAVHDVIPPTSPPPHSHPCRTKQREKSDSLSASWIQAAETELERQASRATLYSSEFSDFQSLTYLYYALVHLMIYFSLPCKYNLCKGSSWALRGGSYVNDYSFSTLVSNVAKLDLDAKAAFVQLLFEEDIQPVSPSFSCFLPSPLTPEFANQTVE